MACVFHVVGGGQPAETMLNVNTQKGLDSLLAAKVKLGGDASIAAGPKGAGANSIFAAGIGREHAQSPR